jgi:hypothetical protein
MIEPRNIVIRRPTVSIFWKAIVGSRKRRRLPETAAGSLRHGSPSFQAISSPVMNGVATYPAVSKSGSSSKKLSWIHCELNSSGAARYARKASGINSTGVIWRAVTGSSCHGRHQGRFTQQFDYE